ncbi:MAG: carbamoyltransferase C-terminal domain-containing protein [Candidatus Omnitrophota bacterium]
MVILGLNIYHGDSSAALVVDGRLVSAIEEERIKRIKHWAGFPAESAAWCMENGGLSIRDVDFIAVSRNPYARICKKILRGLTGRLSKTFLSDRAGHYYRLARVKTALAEKAGTEESAVRARVVYVDHHKAHLAGAFFVSPFQEAALASVDGFGDFASTMLGAGKANKIRVLKTVEFPHSLGLFYTALTQFMGFLNYGDEYKVMGLSAYGKPAYLGEMRKIVRIKKNGLFELDMSYFLHERKGAEMSWLDGAPVIGRLFSDRMTEAFGGPRKDSGNDGIDERICDIAASLQARYEEVLFHMLNHLQAETGLKTLAVAGGCAQNSLANGKIYDKTPFTDLYIPPAAHDGGGAVGAAFYLYNDVLGRPRGFTMESPYWGPDFSDSEIAAVLDARGLPYEVLQERDLIEKCAGAIAAGKIVGWFQGRTEWGPRALGARSILADPRRKEIKDVLNARIKKREWFRPFAPAVLEPKTGEWFERREPVPFMEKVYGIKKEKRHLIPAVCHNDGTGRLETVRRETNPKYYGVIEAFEKLTGVPVILNTSFNENEPICNTPEDAVNCFLKTKMDLLFAGNLALEKQ